MQAMNRENAKMEMKQKDEVIEARKEERVSAQRKRLAEKEEHEKVVQERRAALEAERLERLVFVATASEGLQPLCTVAQLHVAFGQF